MAGAQPVPAAPAPAPKPPSSLGDKFAHLVGSFTISSALALFSAIIAVPAFLTAGVASDAVVSDASGTSVLKEPYLDLGIVKKEYEDQVPRAVELAVRDFDQGTSIDLQNDTQDYQTRYSPDFTCSEAEKDVVSVYGAGACESGSRFYKFSTQYERGLFVINQRGDPATAYDISLDGPELKHAAAVLRRAEADLVACVVVSHEKRPVNVTVSPASGYVVQGDKGFTLAPRGTRRVILKPDEGAGGAAIGEAGCTVDYDLADSAKNAKTPRLFIAVAGLLALVSFGVGILGRARGWKTD